MMRHVNEVSQGEKAGRASRDRLLQHISRGDFCWQVSSRLHLRLGELVIHTKIPLSLSVRPVVNVATPLFFWLLLI